MKKLENNIKFSGFSHLGFFNCMAWVHTYCLQQNTNANISRHQEKWYFMFGTMSGRNSMVERYDRANQRPVDQTMYADFCMKFAGYQYKVVEEDFHAALVDSIDRGYPVIAALKNETCRVLIGYDGDEMICQSPEGAQGENPDPTYVEVDKLYVITGTCEPEYTLLDGLKNVEKSLSDALENGVWAERRSYFPDNEGDYTRIHASWTAFEKRYKDQPLEITKQVFERLNQMCWDFDHCHNVNSAFGSSVYAPLQDKRLAKYCKKLDEAYFDAHNTQWALLGIYELRDWSKKEWQSIEWGMFMLANMGLIRLEQADRCALEQVREMIAILESDPK